VNSTNHSYEEIREVTLKVLAVGVANGNPPAQYDELKGRVAETFQKLEGGRITYGVSGMANLPEVDSVLLFNVFGNLLCEGIILLGLNERNPQFPWFRILVLGSRVLKNRDTYFFEDVSGYEKQLKAQIPNIDPATLVYLKEALQSFKVGCVLASSVMLGVSAEHTFDKLLETIRSNSTHYETYKNVFKETTLLRKLNKFRIILDQNRGALPPEVREDLDINFSAIMSIIRNFRNESGHPTGKIISREQCYSLLQHFIPFCKQVYQLIDEFEKP
jgi:hypothetical protein